RNPFSVRRPTGLADDVAPGGEGSKVAAITGGNIKMAGGFQRIGFERLKRDMFPVRRHRCRPDVLTAHGDVPQYAPVAVRQGEEPFLPPPEYQQSHSISRDSHPDVRAPAV